MTWYHRPVSRLLLRGAGVLLLSATALIFIRLVAVGPEHAGHEPAFVYCLALIGFVCASTGGGLFFYGHHLFDHVRVSELWASRLTLSDLAQLP